MNSPKTQNIAPQTVSFQNVYAQDLVPNLVWLYLEAGPLQLMVVKWVH